MDITLSTLPRPVVAEGNIYIYYFIRFYNMVRVIHIHVCARREIYESVYRQTGYFPNKNYENTFKK